jgi:hypothetical protein
MNSGENVMKKMLCLAVIATAFVGAPAYAKSQCRCRSQRPHRQRRCCRAARWSRRVVVNTSVTTGKGGVLGAVLGKGGAPAVCSAAAAVAGTDV